MVTLTPAAEAGAATFSAEHVRADAAFLYETLQASHFDLFAHTPKDAYDHAFAQLQANITGELDELAVWRLLQSFAVRAGFSHCNVSIPFQSAYAPYVMSGGMVIPLEVTFDKETVVIAHVYGEEARVRPGDRLTAINDEDIASVLADLDRFVAGENMAMKRTGIELTTFPRLHWLAGKAAPRYALSIVKADGSSATVDVEAIPAMAFEQALAARPPRAPPGREFRFIDAVAYLRPGVFLNQQAAGDISDHAALAKGEFTTFLDAALQDLRTKRPSALIIDLRGNPGGDNSFSDRLLVALTDRPFRFCSHFEVRTSEVTKQFWAGVEDAGLASLRAEILSHPNGERFATELPWVEPLPESERYRGRIIALVNRFTLSNAAVTAAMIQDYAIGIIVGEPTADSPSTYGAAHTFALPHSGLTVMYPKARIIRPNGDGRFRGVQPDHVVRDDPFTAADEILEAALVLVRGT